MSYAQFLAIFLLPPVAVLSLLVWRSGSGAGVRGRDLLWQLPLVGLIAVIYTGPWDASLITQGVWSYPPAQVLGHTVLRVPVEEYGFYVLQVLLTGLVAALLWRRLERG